MKLPLCTDRTALPVNQKTICRLSIYKLHSPVFSKQSYLQRTFAADFNNSLDEYLKFLGCIISSPSPREGGWGALFS
jgi:hypothetical protein